MNREQRLVEVFVELADTLVAEFDLVEFLHTLTESCVDLLGVDAAGLMLADQRGALQVMTTTGEQSLLLELFELQHEEGPCLDCFRSGEPILNVDLTQAGGRWPNFADAAVGTGFELCHSLPLRLRSEVIGAMNLFGSGTAQLSEEDVTVAKAMTDVATIGLLQERLVRDQGVLVEQLQTALNGRVLIEQAKGMLAERVDLGMADAFAAMRSHARRNQQPLSQVAAAVIDGSVDVEAIQAH